jgi:WD40 repeat protein
LAEVSVVKFTQRLTFPSLALLGLLPWLAGAQGDKPDPAPVADPLILSLGKTHAIQIEVLQEGKTLATIDNDGKLRLWDLARGEPRGEVAVGHRTNIHQFRFLELPEGKEVVIAGHFEKAYVLDLGTGRLVRELPLFSAWPAGYALADKGKTLVQLDGNLTYHHYDLATGRPKEGAKVPAPPKNEDLGERANLTLAPNGNSYAANGGMCVLRDASTHEVRYKFQPEDRQNAFLYRNGPYRPYYSADSRLVLFQGMDNSLRVVEVATGKEVRTLRLERDPRRAGGLPVIAPAGFAPNGQWVLATTDSAASELILYGVASGLEVRRFPGKVVGPSSWDIALSARGNLLVAPGGMVHQIEIWDMEAGRLKAKSPAEK